MVGPSRKYFWGNQMKEEKAGRPILRWLDCMDSDWKSYVVKKRRKKTEDLSVLAIILKEALLRL